MSTHDMTMLTMTSSDMRGVMAAEPSLPGVQSLSPSSSSGLIKRRSAANLPMPATAMAAEPSPWTALATSKQVNEPDIENTGW